MIGILILAEYDWPLVLGADGVPHGNVECGQHIKPVARSVTTAPLGIVEKVPQLGGD